MNGWGNDAMYFFLIVYRACLGPGEVTGAYRVRIRCMNYDLLDEAVVV